MARLAVALVWLYQGLWCKVLLGCPEHLDILRGVPFLDERRALLGVRAIGVLEVALAVWILAGWRPFAAALVQTLLLIAMNGGGLLWSADTIAAPGAMLTQNLAFLTLAWIVAGRVAAARSDPGSWFRGRLDRDPGPPQMLFGWTYEDPAIEAGLFPMGSRVFCIAAAGDTARALAARGDRVTAVDVNPVQLAYACSRTAGAQARPGAAERRMAAGRRMLRWLGLGKRELASFLTLDDVELQARVWRERISTRRLRALLRVALHPLVLRLLYPRDLVASLPRRFDRVLLARLERTFERHRNRDNRWAWRLFLGEDPPGQEREIAITDAGRPEFLCTDARTYLESSPAACFDGISLSNILDAARADDGERLLAAARRAAKPGARIVLRRFGEPSGASDAAWAARDRSPLWGAIEIMEVGRDGGCTLLAP